VNILHRAVPVVRSLDGLRALSKDKPIAPDGVERCLESKFGEHLEAARSAMSMLAKSYAPDDLVDRAYALYEAFRPKIPAGVKGWGAAGVQDLKQIEKREGNDRCAAASRPTPTFTARRQSHIRSRPALN